ncbi:hypothetical protein AB3N59_19675 [Leptospira sp. WS92.C1]
MFNKISVGFIFFLLFLSQSLFSAEIIFKDGSAFIGKVLEESDLRIKFQWKEKIYEIPRKDLTSIDPSKNGADTSYHYSSFFLKDGSHIKGIVAQETDKEITLKTDLGFIHLDRIKIKETDRPENLNPSFNVKYLDSGNKEWNHKFGISFHGLANGPPLGGTNPLTSGAGFFLEPAFFQIFSFRPGFRIEYQESPGSGHYSFFNQFLYLNGSYRFADKILLDFYSNFGVGASTIQYSGSGQKFGGTDPALYLEIGWQGLQYRSLIFRTGLRSTCIFESSGRFCNGGLEFGVIYVL